MFKNLKIRTKLILGFASVTLIIVLIVVANIVEMRHALNLSQRIITLRVPTAENSAMMENGINHTLAALRGWMLLGEDHFKVERADAWKQEINPALANLQELSKDWTNPENVTRLREIEKLLVRFAQFQQEIEDIAQTPGNVPAVKMLFSEAAPKAAIMAEQITALIDLEANEPATAGRKALLGMMADVRGTIGLSLANTRAFLLSGEEQFKINFEKLWEKNERRFADLKRHQNLLTGEQLKAFQILEETRQKFAPLPAKMFALREGEDWNLANNRLSTMAASTGEQLSVILKAMVKNQQKLLQDDGYEIRVEIEKLITLEWIFLALGVLLAGSFGLLISRSITRPLAQAIKVANQIGEGNLRVAVPEGGNDEAGRLLNALSRMVSELIKKDGAIRENETRIQAILDTAVDGIITIDEHGEIKSFNKSMEKMFGYRVDEIIGQNITTLMPLPFCEQPSQGLARYLKTGEKIIGRSLELEGLRKDRTVFPIEISVGEMALGDHQFFTGIIRDVTKRKQVDDQLIMSEKMVALGNLVAGISHEINTPVGVGVTAASHLRKKTEELSKEFNSGALKKSKLESYLKAALEASDIILTNLRRAGDLVKSFKRVAVDQTSGERRTFGIEEYVRDILLSLRPRLKRTQHVVTVKCPADLSIDSDPGVLSQLVTNLIENSLIHGFENKEKGEITLEFNGNGESVLFHYQDNGKGMAAEDMKKVFDPFFTTKRGQGGSGLGMHIVYNLVTQTLKGSVKCYSNPGKGFGVFIKIPKN